MTDKTIRSLRHGEDPPPGEPLRYLSVRGYIRLRWRTPTELVEVYEHRWVMGNPPSHLHVHHKNGDKQDNRPENLEVLTPSQHSAEHAQIDAEEAARLYATGLSTPEVGRALGFDPATVYRALVRHGVQPRSVSESLRTDLPEGELRYLHAEGVRAQRIAQVYGVTQTIVLRQLRQLGLTSHRVGRPNEREIARAEAAISRVIEGAA